MFAHGTTRSKAGRLATIFSLIGSALVVNGTALVSSAAAAAGDLDTTFSGDGKATTAIGAGFDGGNAVVLQPDGKIVLAGYSHNGTNKDFALVRYNPDGSLDTAFSGDGKLTTPVGSSEDEALGVALQSDGKILAVGYTFNGKDDDMAVVRYNTNGALDTTFDGDGKLTTAIGSSDEAFTSVAVQSDGKIVAGGYTFDGSTEDFAVVRYNPSGSLDTTLDGDGKAKTPIGSSNEQVYALIIQSDSKIVVAGNSYSGGYDDFALARYNTNGSLDTTFSGDGKVTTAISANLDGAYAIRQQADGKLAVAGYAHLGNTGGKFDFALARYNTNGSLDTTFSGDGMTTTPVGNDNEEASGLAIQSDGKLVVAGYSYYNSSNDFALARYNTDGSVDTSFGNSGKITTAVGAGADIAWGIAIQTDGKIVAAGQSSGGWNDDFAVVRYNGGSSSTLPATPALTVGDTTVTEGDSGSVTANFTVTLSAASTSTVSVPYSTSNGTATAGSDYTAASGTVSFAAGQVTQTVSVAVLGDTLDEPNETFHVNLGSSSGATIADGQGLGTINDNDQTPTTSAPGLTIGDASVTEADTTSVMASFTVSLSGASTSTVTVPYSTSNDTATAGSDYTGTSATLTFTAGQTVKTVPVAVLGDTLDEPNETFFVNLGTPSGATISDGQGLATIIDNDPTPTTSTGTHDVGVGRLRTDKRISLRREGVGPHAVFFSVQNLGTVAENISYQLTSSEGVTLSTACQGTITGVGPGSKVQVRGCTVTYSSTNRSPVFTAKVIHDGTDGGTDVNPSNNSASVKVSIGS